jgi:hypothetical protein
VRNRLITCSAAVLASSAPFAFLACAAGTEPSVAGPVVSGLVAHAGAAPVMFLDDVAATAADASSAAAGADVLAAGRARGLRVVRFPGEDPGPPLYARVTPLLNQVFTANGMVAIPFYRDPACVPLDTDLLAHLHPPGEHGPGSFACELLVEGGFTIEPDAPLGTFPVRVVASGPAQIWFVPSEDFDRAAGNGELTMADLIALGPLRGTASSFHEMLAPRIEEHHVVITSHGTLGDGRAFEFNVNHHGDVTRSIQIRFR